MLVEESIAALRQRTLENPCGWLICQEDRPFQAVPAGGSGPHLLFYTTQAKAEAFIRNRQGMLGGELLSVLAIDTLATLKELALSPAGDVRYEPPPCGLVVDFQDASGTSSAVIPADQVQAWMPGQRASIPLPLIPAQPEAPPAAQVSAEPAPAAPPPVPPARSAPARWWGVTGCAGAALVISLLGFCLLTGALAAGLYLERDRFPAISQWFATFTPTPTNTPTPTPTPTLTPTPTITSTPTVTFTPTITPNLRQTEAEQKRQATATERASLLETASANSSLPLILLETFDQNAKSWPMGTFSNDYTHEKVAFSQGKYTLAERPKQPFSESLCPNVVTTKDFYVSVLGRLVEGFPTGDYGIVFRYADQQNYYYFQVSGYGSYALSLFYKGKWINLVRWTYHTAIHTSASGEVNRLAVQGQDDHFALFANDQLLTEIDDKRINRGKACIGIEVYQIKEETRFEFDNFEYHGQ